MQKNTAAFQRVKCSFDQDRDDRGLAANGQDKKRCLKVLDFSGIAPSSFGKCNNRNAVLEEVGRSSQASHSSPGIFSIHEYITAFPKGRAEQRNGKKIFFYDETEVVGEISKQQKNIQKAGVIGHKDIRRILAKPFQPHDTNLNSGGEEADPRPLREAPMGEISVAADETGEIGDHAIEACKREKTKEGEQLIRKKQYPPRYAISTHDKNLTQIAIILQPCAEDYVAIWHMPLRFSCYFERSEKSEIPRICPR